MNIRIGDLVEVTTLGGDVFQGKVSWSIADRHSKLVKAFWIDTSKDLFKTHLNQDAFFESSDIQKIRKIAH